MTTRIFFLLVIILSCSLASAESRNPICNETPDGTVRDYYPDGKLKTEWRCKDGRLNGLTKLYYENGKLEKESHL